MPRTKLTEKYSKAQLPPVDVLKGFMLERMNLKGHRKTYEVLSKETGIGAESLRKLMNEKHTEDWKSEQRRAVCKALGLDEGLVAVVRYVYETTPERMRGGRA